MLKIVQDRERRAGRCSPAFDQFTRQLRVKRRFGGHDQPPKFSAMMRLQRRRRKLNVRKD
jgi:hypothetical protein